MVLNKTGNLYAAVGKIIKVRGKSYYVSLGSDDGMMVGERVLLYDRKGFDAGRRVRLAILIVKKVFPQHSIANISKLTNRKYIRKRPGILKSAVAVFGAMVERAYIPKIKSEAPRALFFMDSSMSRLVANRINIVMPEMTGGDPSSNIVQRYDQDIKSNSVFRYGISSVLYPLSFFTRKFIWEVLGFSISYYRIYNNYTLTPHSESAETNEGISEAAITDWVESGLNFRIPITFSPNLYIESLLKLDLVNFHSFNILDGDGDIRSLGFQFLTLKLEEHMKLYKVLWFRLGGGVPLQSNGKVLPDSVLVDDRNVKLNYDSFHMLTWFASLGAEFRSIHLLAKYEWTKYMAVASGSQYVSSLKYSNIGVSLGYSF